MSFTIDIPALALLEAEFLVLRRIGGLPEYHGIQWSSLFKHLLRRRLGLPEPVPEGFVPRMGLLPAYPPSQSVVPGVSLFLRMVLPLPMPEVMQGVLEEFNRESFTNGQFQPGRTIRLDRFVIASEVRKSCRAPAPAVGTALSRWACKHWSRKSTNWNAWRSSLSYWTHHCGCRDRKGRRTTATVFSTAHMQQILRPLDI